MAGFVCRLSKVEQSDLTRLIRSGQDGRIIRRAHMIQLSTQGVKVPEIAAAWHVTAQAVLKTLHRFDTVGPESLVGRPRSGRPAKVSDQHVEVFKDVARRFRRDLDYPFSSWTLTHLRLHPKAQASYSTPNTEQDRPIPYHAQGNRMKGHREDF